MRELSGAPMAELFLNDGVPFYELPGRLPDVEGPGVADIPDWAMILLGAMVFALAGAAAGLALHI